MIQPLSTPRTYLIPTTTIHTPTSLVAYTISQLPPTTPAMTISKITSIQIYSTLKMPPLLRSSSSGSNLRKITHLPSTSKLLASLTALPCLPTPPTNTPSLNTLNSHSSRSTLDPCFRASSHSILVSISNDLLSRPLRSNTTPIKTPLSTLRTTISSR